MKRTRVRTTDCVMPDCEREAHRGNRFPLCVNHLLLIWKHVESGETVSDWQKDAHAGWPSANDAIAAHVATADEVEARRLAARQKQREIATAPGTLYALDTREGNIKIGWTGRSLQERLGGYPPHFRVIISVPGTRADERDVHRSLKMFRSAKREWYRPEGEVVRQINTWIALSNTIEVQRARDAQELYGHANPSHMFRPALLPRFESLETWMPKQSAAEAMPGPKSKGGAWRVA